jgi:hypothetical protein
MIGKYLENLEEGMRNIIEINLQMLVLFILGLNNKGGV